MDLIGWPDYVRPQLLDMAVASFDVAGPDNARTRDAVAKMQQMFGMIAQVYDEGSLAPGGFGSTVAEAARRDSGRAAPDSTNGSRRWSMKNSWRSR